MVHFTHLPSRETEEETVDMPESGSSDPEGLNGKLKRESHIDGEESKKKRKRSKVERSTKVNVSKPPSKRRHSVVKPARDPRDEAPQSTSPGEDGEAVVRSPSPVIDFDGLSKPSKWEISI
jgi:GTP cyclohydrolase I